MKILNGLMEGKTNETNKFPYCFIESLGKDQMLVSLATGMYFFSYGKRIIFFSKGQTYLDKYNWDVSATTSKYRVKVLREKKAETLTKIKSGEYKLVDLN